MMNADEKGRIVTTTRKYSHTICSSCKIEINTVKDTHDGDPEGHMVVPVTNCCNVEPQPIYKEERQ